MIRRPERRATGEPGVWRLTEALTVTRTAGGWRLVVRGHDAIDLSVAELRAVAASPELIRLVMDERGRVL